MAHCHPTFVHLALGAVPCKGHCSMINATILWNQTSLSSTSDSATFWASHVVLVVKNPPANAGDLRGTGSIPVLGRSPGRGHGNPLQYSCLENPMDRGAWRAIAHGFEQSQTLLKWLGTHICHFLPGELWMEYITPLRLSVLLYKLIFLTLSLGRFKEITYIRTQAAICSVNSHCYYSSLKEELVLQDSQWLKCGSICKSHSQSTNTSCWDTHTQTSSHMLTQAREWASGICENIKEMPKCRIPSGFHPWSSWWSPNSADLQQFHQENRKQFWTLPFTWGNVCEPTTHTFPLTR